MRGYREPLHRQAHRAIGVRRHRRHALDGLLGWPRRGGGQNVDHRDLSGLGLILLGPWSTDDDSRPLGDSGDRIGETLTDLVGIE